MGDTHLEVDEEGEADARWDDRGGNWQTFKIGKTFSGKIMSGDEVWFLVDHTDKHLDADPSGSVQARWNDAGGAYQRFLVEKLDRRPGRDETTNAYQLQDVLDGGDLTKC